MERPPAELILRGGKVVTVDNGFRIHQAIGIAGEKIVSVGTDGEVETSAGHCTRRINLAGHTVIPGLIDGHAHMDNEGLKTIHPSLAGAYSIREIIERIESIAQENAPGDWIVTMPIGDPPYYRGVPETLSEGRYPNRWELDEAAPDNPVFIKPVYGYWRGLGGFPLVSVANSVALQLAGINRDTVPPWGGIQIDKEYTTGEPTGIFLEWTPISVVELTLMAIVPRFTQDDRLAALGRSMAVYNSFGTTSIIETHGVAPEVLETYRALEAAAGITVRSHLMISPPWRSAAGHEDLSNALRNHYARYAGIGIGDAYLRVGGIFTRVGGTPDAELRTAAMPYTGWGGFAPDAEVSPEQVRTLVFEAARLGLRVTTLYPDLLDVFEEADRVAPISHLRWVISHIRTLDTRQIDRIRKLGIHVTLQTNRWIADQGADLKRQLGPEREHEIVPLRSLSEAGVTFALASDNCPPSLFHPIWHCVARYHCGTGEVIAAEQRITREEALRAATINGAALTFEENEKGSNEIGKLADLVVLSDDPLTVAQDSLKDIVSELTIVGGKIVSCRHNGQFGNLTT